MTPEERRADYAAIAPVLEYVREDMRDLIGGVRALTAEVANMRNSLDQIKARVGTLENLQRPCRDLQAHLEAHEREFHRQAAERDRRSDRWWTVWVRVAAGIITWILAAAFGAMATIWGMQQ